MLVNRKKPFPAQNRKERMHATSKSICWTQIDPNKSSNPFTITTYLLPFALTHPEMNKSIGNTGPICVGRYTPLAKFPEYRQIRRLSTYYFPLSYTWTELQKYLHNTKDSKQSLKIQEVPNSAKEFASSFAKTRTPRVNAFQYSQKAFIFSVPLIKQHCY